MTSDSRDEVRAFLMTRRAKVTPESVALQTGGNRRVPGLRRGEVAALAGVSVEYYSRLERGDLAGVSESILDSIAQALRLDESEREHLFDLSRTANSSPLRRSRIPKATTVRPALVHVLSTITGGPAFIRNGRLDLLASNELGRALYADVFAETPNVNLARFAFLQRHLSDRFYPDWGLAADQCVAVLRTEAGRDPYDRSLQDLVGELSTRSDEFRRRWGAHDVARHTDGRKVFRHPVVGDVDFIFEGMDLKSDPGLNLMIYAAEPGSPTADAVSLLASWWATHQQSVASDRGEAGRTIGTPNASTKEHPHE